MSIPLKVDTSTGNLAQFLAADDLDIDVISVRGTGNMTIAANLGSGDELQLGASGELVRVMGDFQVDGSSTVSTNETVTGTFNANGNVNLGNNSGDTINLGGGTSDTVNLESHLVLGAGTIKIGSSVTDYLSELWLIAVNDNGPNADAYDLQANGTNCGAYSIGVDPSLVTSSSSTDLMTMLVDMDGAISGGAASLQATYATGNTIDVTSANGIVDLENSTNSDTTTVLKIHREPTASTAGIGLDVYMSANATGIGVNIVHAGSGDALFVNNTGSGDALDIQDGGGSVLQVTGAGVVNITPTSGQDINLTATGAGFVDIDGAGGVDIDSSGGTIDIGTDADTGNINIGTSATARTIALGNAASTEIQLDAILVDINAGASGFTIDGGAASTIATSAGNLSLDSAAAELVFDDVGNSGITLSQSSDRTLSQTGSTEVLNGVTSIIGALNALADAVDVSGLLVAEDPIENAVTVTAGDVVAASTTSGRVTQANGNNNTNGRVIGIALNTGTGDVGGTVICRYALIGSRVTDSGASFTAGNALFVPDGTGRPTATAPSGTGDLVKRVGWAITSTEYVTDAGPSVIL